MEPSPRQPFRIRSPTLPYKHESSVYSGPRNIYAVLSHFSFCIYR